MYGRPLLAGIFAIALMLQTTCDAFCLTSYCDDDKPAATLAAPHCHHSDHTDKPAEKSKECSHRKWITAPAVQTKIASHEFVIAPVMPIVVQISRSELRLSLTSIYSAEPHPPNPALRI